MMASEPQVSDMMEDADQDQQQQQTPDQGIDADDDGTHLSGGMQGQCALTKDHSATIVPQASAA